MAQLGPETASFFPYSTNVVSDGTHAYPEEESRLCHKQYSCHWDLDQQDRKIFSIPQPNIILSMINKVINT